MNKLILNSDVIPLKNRAEVERVVCLHFDPPGGMEFCYEARGITRALLALPLAVLSMSVYKNLRPEEDSEGAVTDGAVTIFQAIDGDIAFILHKAKERTEPF